MFCLVLFLICAFMSLFVGALAAWSDIRGMTIPNIYSAIVGGLFVVAYVVVALMGPEGVFGPWVSHLVAGLIVFAVTVLLFAARALGGADSKLATVFALWVGIQGLSAFLLYTTLAGGVLGLTALAIRHWKLFANAPAGSWPAQIQAGASKVPYGVAILTGAVIAFFYAGYFSPETLSSFVGGN